MALEIYRRKRNFDQTREPRGRLTRRKRKDLTFVVHKHDARRLHYDLRLEMNGVLASWAVPKGPSLNPKERRLAVQVEDHPLEYRDFEGTIPEGEYGAGSVIVWDRGTWQPDGDPAASRRRGKLKFSLRGEKLSGGWTLVRMASRNGTGNKNWLLIKEADEDASRGDATRDRPENMKTGRAVEITRGKTPPTRQEIAGVNLTNPDRILFPEQNVSKADLARYYAQVSDWILPHLEGRPLTLVRCPEGRKKQCFYQRHVGASLRPPIRTISVKESGKPVSYVSVDSLPGLIELVQMGVLEIHTWGARQKNLERPDRLTFDLDPDPQLPWKSIKEAALVLRSRLARLDLASFVKTTGGKGLHVVVPIKPTQGWDEVKQFARNIAEGLAESAPELYTASASKAQRHGKIFIDYLRNGRSASAVAAYSSRAREGAPVSVPLGWQELTVDPRADHFNISNVPKRLAGLRQDPWVDYERARHVLGKRLIRMVSR